MSPPDSPQRALLQAVQDAITHLSRRPVGAFVDPCPNIRRVRIIRLSFLFDHELLTDYDVPYGTSERELDRWKTGGIPYKQKAFSEWAEDHSFPISQTKNTTLTVVPEFEVTPPQPGPCAGEIQAQATTEMLGMGPRPEWAFNGSGPVGPGASPVVLPAGARIADKVTQHHRSLAWTVTLGGVTYYAGFTGPHHVYATYGRPVPGGEPQHTPYGDDPPVDEEGITEHRMRAAIVLTEAQLAKLATAAQRNDPHTIVKRLMALVSHYTLAVDGRVPEAFDHPRFYPELKPYEKGKPWPWPRRGGAWPIADYRSSMAECQAICRFVRGILMQIGCPGQADVVCVYAHHKTRDGKMALEDSLVPEDKDKDKYKKTNGKWMLKPGLKRYNAPNQHWWQLLADREVKVGETIAQGEVFNSYEACLRFTHGGSTRYYGGGMPDWDFGSPQEVLKAAFWSLVWVTRQGDDSKRVESVVATRADW